MNTLSVKKLLENRRSYDSKYSDKAFMWLCKGIPDKVDKLNELKLHISDYNISCIDDTICLWYSQQVADVSIISYEGVNLYDKPHENIKLKLYLYIDDYYLLFVGTIEHRGMQQILNNM